MKKEELEHRWREVIGTYLKLKKLHGQFVQEANGFLLDHLGPELQKVFQMRLHKRRFSIFLEDLLHWETTKGNLNELTPKPPKDSTSKVEQPERTLPKVEQPKEMKDGND